MEVFRDANGKVVIIIEYREKWTAWFQYTKWFIKEVCGLDKTDQWLVPPSHVGDDPVEGRWPAEPVRDLRCDFTDLMQY